MCDSTAPNSAATLIALANWFARYVTGSVIGLTTVPRHTCLFVQHAGLTTQPRRIRAPPHCRSCDGSHPTSDPNCPRRARQTPNKAWVRKALKKEQR
ncbi:hypothetical protein MRX96_037499 [Rhipicephalus microplus]